MYFLEKKEEEVFPYKTTKIAPQASNTQQASNTECVLLHLMQQCSTSRRLIITLKTRAAAAAALLPSKSNLNLLSLEAHLFTED